MANVAFCFGNKFLVVRDCVVHVFCISLKIGCVISNENIIGCYLFIIYYYPLMKIISDYLQQRMSYKKEFTK